MPSKPSSLRAPSVRNPDQRSLAPPKTETDARLNKQYDCYNFPIIAIDSAQQLGGHSGRTTSEQEDKIEQLRAKLLKYNEGKPPAEQIPNARLDTLTLLRYLRARKWKVDEGSSPAEDAEKMFIANEVWRQKWSTEKHIVRQVNGDIVHPHVDDLPNGWENEYPEKGKIYKYYPQYYHKTDNDGRPLYIEHFGKIDLAAMRKITTDEKMLTNLVVEYERVADPRLPACSRKAGRLLETCCSIMDMQGVSLWNAKQVYGYLQSASGVLQDHYPERLGKLFIINAPWGFASVFSFIKSFLDPVTVAKIHVLGSNYKSELVKHIPPENLPTDLGGACRCEVNMDKLAQATDKDMQQDIANHPCKYSDAGPWQQAEFMGPYFVPEEQREGFDPEQGQWITNVTV